MLYHALVCVCVIAAFVLGCHAGHGYLSRGKTSARCRDIAANVLIVMVVAVCCHFLCRACEYAIVADCFLAAVMCCAGILMELARTVNFHNKPVS